MLQGLPLAENEERKEGRNVKERKKERKKEGKKERKWDSLQFVHNFT